jgi:hypothetical protein
MPATAPAAYAAAALAAARRSRRRCCRRGKLGGDMRKRSHQRRTTDFLESPLRLARFCTEHVSDALTEAFDARPSTSPPGVVDGSKAITILGSPGVLSSRGPDRARDCGSSPPDRDVSSRSTSTSSIRLRSASPKSLPALLAPAACSMQRSWLSNSVSSAIGYANAERLGAIRLGSGPRARLRFELGQAREALALTAVSEHRASVGHPVRRRRGRPPRSTVPPGVSLVQGRSGR